MINELGQFVLDDDQRGKLTQTLADFAVQLDDTQIFEVMTEIGFGRATLTKDLGKVRVTFTDLQLVAAVTAFKAYAKAFDTQDLGDPFVGDQDL